MPRLRANARAARAFLQPAEDAVLRRGGAAPAGRRRHSVDGRRRGAAGAIPLVTGLGATESAPFALCAGDSDFSGGRIGVPAPGVELKLAPVGTAARGAAAGAEHHARLLARRRADARGVRRRRLLQAGRRARVLRSAGSVEGLHVRGAAGGGLQAVDRHLGQGRAAAAATARALRRPRAGRRRSPATSATRSPRLRFRDRRLPGVVRRRRRGRSPYDELFERDVVRAAFCERLDVVRASQHRALDARRAR